MITKATWGGAQRYVYDLATHLLPQRFDVHVAYGEPGRLETMLEEKKIPTRRVPALGRDVALLSDIQSFLQILTLLRKERPDVVHLNSSKAAALGALAARLCGVPKIIFTVHGWPFKEGRGAIATFAIYLISWFTAFLSTATIVVSKRDEAIGKKMLFVSGKIHYVPLGIVAPKFLSREEASAKLGITTNLPRIITIAELTKNKGIEYAIDAIALLKKNGTNVSYFIIGDGELRAELIERAQELNVSDCVHFLGFVGDAAQYLKAFNIFLLPSIKEGTPYVLLEAATAAMQIVTTSVIDRTLGGNIMFVPPANSETLADALADAKSYLNEGEAETYDISNMVGATVSLY